MTVEVRAAIVIAALVLLSVCLGIAFVHVARSIMREHDARFRRIQRRLEGDASALVDRLLATDRTDHTD